jgi:hypothetical protein
MNEALVECAHELNLPEPASLALLPSNKLVRVQKAAPPPPPQAEGQQHFSSLAVAPRVPPSAAAPMLLMGQQQQPQEKRSNGRTAAALLLDAIRSGGVEGYVRPAASQQRDKVWGRARPGAWGLKALPHRV